MKSFYCREVLLTSHNPLVKNHKLDKELVNIVMQLLDKIGGWSWDENLTTLKAKCCLEGILPHSRCGVLTVFDKVGAESISHILNILIQNNKYLCFC